MKFAKPGGGLGVPDPVFSDSTERQHLLVILAAVFAALDQKPSTPGNNVADQMANAFERANVFLEVMKTYT